jgi:hypothetical protein
MFNGPPERNKSKAFKGLNSNMSEMDGRWGKRGSLLERRWGHTY